MASIGAMSKSTGVWHQAVSLSGSPLQKLGDPVLDDSAAVVEPEDSLAEVGDVPPSLPVPSLPVDATGPHASNKAAPTLKSALWGKALRLRHLVILTNPTPSYSSR